MVSGRIFMYLNKKLLAISLAAISILCAACNKTTENQNNTTENTNTKGNVAVDNAILPEVNDDMAPTDEEKIDISIGLVKNSAPALGAVHLFVNSNNNSAYEKYTPVVYNTSDELLNAFSSGEINAAVLPSDKAAKCYETTGCYVTAVTTGCNYYIAENGSTVSDIPDLNGKTITVSAEDTMAQSILNIIAKYNNITVNYAAANTTEQLINGLKDGSINLALIQEPYLSRATSENVRSAIDLYDYWNDASDTELVTSCLVVNKNFVSENSIAFQFFMKDYQASAPMAKRAAAETAQSAGEFALVDDVNSSKAAIPGCGITFKTNEEMKTMLQNFYNIIAAENTEILGGQVPQDDFYFINENN